MTSGLVLVRYRSIAKLWYKDWVVVIENRSQNGNRFQSRCQNDRMTEGEILNGMPRNGISHTW